MQRRDCRTSYPAILLSLFLLGLVLNAGCSGKQPMMSVGGAIVDEKDAPVENVRVTISIEKAGYGSTHVEAKSDANGQWHAEIPKHLATFAWQLQHPEFPLSTTFGWQTVTDELRQGKMRTVIHRGLQMRGILVDEAGAPVRDALVIRDFSSVDKMSELRERVKSGQEESIVLSDSEGRFNVILYRRDSHPHSSIQPLLSMTCSWS